MLKCYGLCELGTDMYIGTKADTYGMLLEYCEVRTLQGRGRGRDHQAGMAGPPGLRARRITHDVMILCMLRTHSHPSRPDEVMMPSLPIVPQANQS